jgi:hypothetical protein
MHIARTMAEGRASFCLQIIPILIGAPFMKQPNRFPKVWLLDRYCFFWSKPTTVSHVYSRLASNALPYHV